jgi:F-type H+-transporting ATPase subunit epsilon
MVSEESKNQSNNTISLEIVTPEQMIYCDNVNYISIPGVEGELGILPHHSPLMTMIKAGEIRVIKGDEEVCIAIGGGFLEVKPDRVIVLADMAERDDMIDEEKVQEAIARAKEASSVDQKTLADKDAIEAALRFEMARLSVLEKQKKKRNKRLG